MTFSPPQEVRPDEPPYPGQLPCSECGWWVTPGWHSEASCHANQQQNGGLLADAKADKLAKGRPETKAQRKARLEKGVIRSGD